jgi:hypothetical protein
MPQTDIGTHNSHSPFAPLAYTIDDAVSASGFSRSRIYDEISAGRLRAVKAGKRTLVFADSLRSLLEALPPVPIGTGPKQETLEGSK